MTRSLGNKKMKFNFLKLLLIFTLTVLCLNCDLEYITHRVEINEKLTINQINNLIEAQIIELNETSKFALPEKMPIKGEGYVFEIKGDEKSFQILAMPKQCGKTGKRTFYFDSKDGNIHGADCNAEKVSNASPMVEALTEDKKRVLKSGQVK
jgi:hypothetical protein